jgi:hypothetical protein
MALSVFRRTKPSPEPAVGEGFATYRAGSVAPADSRSLHEPCRHAEMPPRTGCNDGDGAVREPLPAASRRLRVMEIAVLADDVTFGAFVDRLSATVAGDPPHSTTWYDGADLPELVRAERLQGLTTPAGSAPRRQPLLACQPGWSAHPEDFW